MKHSSEQGGRMNKKENSLRTLFIAAVEISDGAERIAYLQRVCGDDVPRRQRLDQLLRAHADAGGFTHPEGETNVILPVTEKPGDCIGRYKLREQIGEGGGGVVYVAEQEEPVRRRVALKVIKLGMDTRSVVARFEAERQALAMMEHPNIARVLDAGATESGRPYFVMELVRGIKITDYCDQNRLSTKERLDLFIQVCHAIQHAHQKGIIHRDIKPSNVLVTLHDSVPVPKVIDFGIAKATEGRLTDLTIYTELHQFIGTPAYMSPEHQAQPNAPKSPREEAQRPFFQHAGFRRGGQDLRTQAAPNEGNHPPASGRSRLDRDEVPREGPHAPLRDGQRPGG
jgi:hypothetical protein